MKLRNITTLILMVVLSVSVAIVGCSKKGDLLTEVSGQWQDAQDNSPVEINLAGDTKSITVQGKTYPVTVESVEALNYVVSLKVQNGGEKPESWTLQQIWDEGGDAFKIAFNHNGQKNMLISKGQS